jgi:Transposase DDE domain group 1
LPMIKIIIDKLRKAWPDVEILLRADAAFGDKKTFRWCEAQQKPVLYTIGIKGNNNLYNDSKSFDGQVCRLFNRRFGNQKLVAKKKLKKKNI